MSLAETRFALALLDRDRPAPPGIVGPDRFAVYRNNVQLSLIEALEARFPVARAVVGADFFRDMARRFLELCPPRSPLLMTWGDGLADFIAQFPPAAPVPFLADLARLEAAQTEAYHAADAEALDPSVLAEVPASAWAAARLTLHPSVRTVASAWPIATIWQAHRDERRDAELDWRGEDVLICRPDWWVEVLRLPPGGAGFVGSLNGGRTLAEAARCFGGSGIEAVSACLSTLILANGIVRVEHGA